MPRPSSPVHAKASTNCPYLTLESPHHQRQHWISLPTDTKLGRAVSRGCFGVVENRSAFVVMNASSLRSRQPCGQRFLSEPTPHGIDLKKPFTMSNIGKRALTASLLVSTTRISFSSSSKIAVVCVPACARQSQQSCALWARFAALAVLEAMHRSFATSSSLLRTGGAYRDRTDDLMLAKQPLSQLS